MQKNLTILSLIEKRQKQRKHEKLKSSKKKLPLGWITLSGCMVIKSKEPEP
jgi:hypothetical protein